MKWMRDKVFDSLVQYEYLKNGFKRYEMIHKIPSFWVLTFFVFCTLISLVSIFVSILFLYHQINIAYSVLSVLFGIIVLFIAFYVLKPIHDDAFKRHEQLNRHFAQLCSEIKELAIYDSSRNLEEFKLVIEDKVLDSTNLEFITYRLQGISSLNKSIVKPKHVEFVIKVEHLYKVKKGLIDNVASILVRSGYYFSEIGELIKAEKINDIATDFKTNTLRETGEYLVYDESLFAKHFG